MTTKQDRRIAKLMDDVDDFTGRRITRANAEAILHRLGEIMREPGPGEVRVRVAVLVAPEGCWSAAGGHDMSDEWAAERAEERLMAVSQIRWIEANVPAWAPPAEVTVEGEVAE